MSEGRASRQERRVLGVLLVGLYLVAASIVANSGLNVLRREIGPDPTLAVQVLVLAAVTLVSAVVLAVRDFGWVGGVKVIAPNLWSGLIVAFIAAMATVMPIRANTPPGGAAWIVLAPIYVAALAFAWWFAQQAPWVEPERPVAKARIPRAEAGAPRSREDRMNSAAEGTMVTAVLMATVVIFSLLFAGVGWEDAGEAVPTVDVIAASGELALVGSPGEEVRFRLVGRVLGGARWASDSGLSVVGIGDGDQLVVEPREKKWGEAVSVGNGSLDDLNIKAKMRIPEEIRAGTTVEGRLKGDFVTAQASSGGTFSNREQQLDVPVEVRVVSAQESASERDEREGPGLGKMRISLWVAAVAAGIGVIFGFTSWGLFRKLR